MSPKARRRARVVAMQALYQWHLNQTPSNELQAEFRVANAHYKCDWILFGELLTGVLKQVSTLDALIEPKLVHPMAVVNPVELAILRLGAFELKDRLDIPYRVVISQYVDIALEFGAQDGEKFVNGVLDKLSTSLRQAEVKTPSS